MLIWYQNHKVVTGLHCQIKIVRYPQGATAEVAANSVNQGVQHIHSRDIDPLARFVQDQQIRSVNQCPRQQQALEFSSRQGRDRRVAEPFQSDSVERGIDVRVQESARELHQATHGKRKCRADCQPLRNVAHLQ